VASAVLMLISLVLAATRALGYAGTGGTTAAPTVAYTDP